MEKKKSKKVLIIVLIVVFLLLIGLLLFFILKGDDKVTVTFDSDGGTPVETQKIKKGGTIAIPESTKEGFVLDGWYKDDQKVTSKTYIFADTTLKAKWTTEAAKTYTITFDSKGGSEVEKLVVECEKEVKFGEAPTREGYTFVSWVDKNETPILDGALLSCEDVTLYANWEKKEEQKEEKKYYTVTFDSKGGSKVNPIKVDCSKTLTLPANPTRTGYKFVSWYDKHGKTILTGALLSCENITLYADWKAEEPATPEKQYKCPSGYTLNTTTHKCTIEGTVKQKCPNDTYEFEGKCITLTAQAQNSDQVTRVCGKTTVVVDNNGHTQEVQGTVKYAGYYYCAYGEVSQSNYECTSHGYKWIDNKCYRTTTGPSVNITYGCKVPTAYAYLTTAQVNSLRQNANISGCFPYTSKTPYCDSDYTLTNGKCIKTIDATYE